MYEVKNVVFCAETEKSHLIKFVSSKKTAWVPKKCIEIIDVSENRLTGRVIHKVKIEKWLFDKIKNN
jgi:hypothetical protein